VILAAGRTSGASARNRDGRSHCRADVVAKGGWAGHSRPSCDFRACVEGEFTLVRDSEYHGVRLGSKANPSRPQSIHWSQLCST
jgi:hypothetical protein